MLPTSCSDSERSASLIQSNRIRMSSQAYATSPAAPIVPGHFDHVSVRSRDRNPWRAVIKTAFPVLDSLTTLVLPAIIKTSFPSLAAMLACYLLGYPMHWPYTIFEVNAVLVLLRWPLGLLEPDRFVARLTVAEKVAQLQLLLYVTVALWQGRLQAWGIQENSSPFAAFGGPLLNGFRSILSNASSTEVEVDGSPGR